VLKILKDSLCGENQQDMALLALYICKEDSPQPLPDILLRLFRKGCSVTKLLSVLLKCESVRLQFLFAGHSSMPLHAQFEDLRKMLHDFNGIQDAVMEMGEVYLAETEAKTIRSVDVEMDDSGERISGYVGMSREEVASHRKNILLSSMIEWTKQGQAKLYNIYRGIPISISARVLGSKDEMIRIRLDREVGKVFSSHPLQDHAYLACSGGEDQVRVAIEKVDHGVVTLALKEISPSYLDRRDNLGVQIADSVPVEIVSRGRKIGTVHLFDASISGLGFLLKQSDQTPYSAGDAVECRFKLGDREIHATGWIRWLQAHEGGTRIGMELKADKVVQQNLQREIFRIQREIIVAMNELEMPEAFQPFL
jgi:hypothetical protein